MLLVDWSRIDPPLTDEEKEHGAYVVGILMSACGMSEIKTDKDVEEMYMRLTLYDRLHGRPSLASTDSANLNTLTLWQRWLGVTVNGARETRRQWIKRITDTTFLEIAYEMRQQEKVSA